MRGLRGFLLTLLLVALGVIVPSGAWARPGGGQSFSSSRSSYSSSGSTGSSWSSSGSSWGSSGSSRSSSGTGFSWGSSTGTRSSDTSSGTSSGYTPPVDTSALDRQQDELDCMQRCMMVGIWDAGAKDSCNADCIKEKADARQKAREDAEREEARNPPVPDPPMYRVFIIPGFLLLGVGLVVGVRRIAKQREEQQWASIDAAETAFAVERERELARSRFPSIAAALRALRATDSGFSWILFEDFAHALYTEAHTLRGGKRLSQIKPFMSQTALENLARYPADTVDAIIVGSAETLEVVAKAEDRRVRARIRFEANYTEHAAGSAQSYYSHEIWIFSRNVDIASRTPERARVIGCANCGAPLEKLAGEKCEFCGAPSAPGAQDWVVEDVQFIERNPRPPQLTGDTEEVGTDDPTLVAPDVKTAYAELAERDPAFAWSAFVSRVGLVFQSFHRAWSAQELSGVRPFMSDNLFETQRYWVSAYKAQKLKNVTEKPEIVSVQLSRVLTDALFDAITVRVFAQCIDYTLDASGKIVSGRRDAFRRYSEYWTFIRSVKKRGAPGTEPRCPSCGAPLEKINMAGECESCHSKVTSGEFDWVLSRVEQDEVYRL